MFKNLGLVVIYEKIVIGGCDVFYKGDIVWVIVVYMKEQGGYLSYEDLVVYIFDWVMLVLVNYCGYDVWELLFNGQGIVVLQIFNILEQYDIEGMGWDFVDYIYIFVEVKKLVFEDCVKYYVDLVFNDILVVLLISKEYVWE